MIRIYQDEFEKGSGNCFSACLASILEKNLEHVPNFNKLYGINMVEHAEKWLLKHYSICMVTIQMEDREDENFSGKDIRILRAHSEILCIAGGRSAAIPDCNHAVVGTFEGSEFKVVHDPNPSTFGLDGFPKWIYFLFPLQLTSN